MSANKHENVYKGKKHIFFNNMLGGLAWGLGVTVGLAIVLAVLGFIANHTGGIPYIGDFLSNTFDSILQNEPQLIK